ncbi:hypothetical protein B5M06_14785 [Comamonas kerstersii]|uniref:Phage tail assembly protein n=1 Tax=Comamonas kerstersii TaxID=225992 RepID=A0A1V0BHC2_9BURK|nr:phage tail assembly chaperone [Comamonas kerstersii]AQZ99326.1 hypothetical protein B5M06_14785 [Comamonas kerstersii]DAE39871.1 MAG TPA: tail assembly chaperone [Caudoviricetes sp.]
MTERKHPKFTLEADPTFELPVLIPRLGLPSAEVQVTFKARSPEEMVALDKKFREEKPSDAEAVLEVASGWSLADAFTADNIAAAQAKHPGFAGAVIKAYFREYERVRLGN